MMSGTHSAAISIQRDVEADDFGSILPERVTREASEGTGREPASFMPTRTVTSGSMATLCDVLIER